MSHAWKATHSTKVNNSVAISHMTATHAGNSAAWEGQHAIMSPIQAHEGSMFPKCLTSGNLNTCARGSNAPTWHISVSCQCHWPSHLPLMSPFADSKSRPVNGSKSVAHDLHALAVVLKRLLKHFQFLSPLHYSRTKPQVLEHFDTSNTTTFNPFSTIPKSYQASQSPVRYDYHPRTIGDPECGSSQTGPAWDSFSWACSSRAVCLPRSPFLTHQRDLKTV